jgi:hypothetical protein
VDEGISMTIFRALPRVAVLVVTACSLSACFDLEQKVALHRDGSGAYAVILASDGVVGKSLDKKHADIDLGDNRAVTHISHHGDETVQTSEVAFRDLSDLKLGDETIRLHVTGKKFLGLGATEVNFHRTFRVDSARHHHESADDEHLGRDILHSMFGDHTYTFAVWLPGSIDRIAPLRVGDHFVQPVVWGDAYGHTIIWTMKLTDMFLADRLDFDVDFAAHGDFHDTMTSPDSSHHHHHET